MLTVRVSERGAVTRNSLEAGVTPQGVVPGLFDEHPIQRQNMEPNLDQNILEHSRAAHQDRK